MPPTQSGTRDVVRKTSNHISLGHRQAKHHDQVLSPGDPAGVSLSRSALRAPAAVAVAPASRGTSSARIAPATNSLRDARKGASDGIACLRREHTTARA